ncbi:MAG TPA: aminopeptidase N, partial [Pseudomonadales bacterium]|nr:aminopeptidase N [Pseudomonadales bacterium]
MKDNNAPHAIYLKDYRPPAFLIDKTELTFKLFEQHTEVFSRLTMRRNPVAERATLLHLDGGDRLRLQSIALNGRTLQQHEFSLIDNNLELAVETDDFVLDIVTEIQPHLNTRLEGLYLSKGMFCTQCEAEGFRHITYYLDRPDVMSKFTTRIEADNTLFPVLLSNGNKIGAGALAEGRHWAEWQDPFKKPCYLFALVAGDLAVKQDRFTTMHGRDVLLQLFVEPSDLNKCDFALHALKQAMLWDEQVYGREYDLDIYMIVAVSHFNMGAMENKGLNIFNTSCVLANPETTTDAAFQRVEGVVAHEYFHNWSGNRVTCRDWFQLSLKEGFTVFRDEEFSADSGSRTVKRIEDVTFLRTQQFSEDAGPLAHPVRPESYIEMNNFYTSTVYNKGAEVVRMIHTLVGKEGFRKGCDLYFERFDGQAVTTDDFVACMEEANAIDLRQFRRWYTQAGTPRLLVTDHYDAATRTYRLEISQHCNPTPQQPVKEPFFLPFKMALLDEQGQALPLMLKHSDDSHGAIEKTLIIHERDHQFEFLNVNARPTPSLLRGFSAPVHLDYSYSKAQLSFLMAHDSDGFNRWD